MSTQSYYLTTLEDDANICNYNIPFSVNCCGFVDAKASFRNTTSRKDFYYMYVIKGKLETHLGPALPGDMLLFEPEYQYSYKSDGNTAYLWMHFTGNTALDFVKNLSLPLATIKNIGIHEIIKQRFEHLFREFILNDALSAETKICICKEILLLSRRYLNISSLNESPYKAIDYINKHYAEDINISYLAELESMSLTKFRILFKKHTSNSPLEYITLKRISAACRLLTQSNSSMSEIATNVGYDDVYYFSRIFKKKTGLSPKDYRKKNKIHYL